MFFETRCTGVPANGLLPTNLLPLDKFVQKRQNRIVQYLKRHRHCYLPRCSLSVIRNHRFHCITYAAALQTEPPSSDCEKASSAAAPVQRKEPETQRSPRINSSCLILPKSIESPYAILPYQPPLPVAVCTASFGRLRQ